MNNTETEAFETVQIPKVTVDYLRGQDFFRFYNDLDDFVMDAVRKEIEELIRTGIMT